MKEEIQPAIDISDSECSFKSEPDNLSESIFMDATPPESPIPENNKIEPNTPPSPKKAKLAKEESNSTSTEKAENASNQMKKPIEENEFEYFGKTIAIHLKKLPEPIGLESMATIQNYLIQQRLKAYNERLANEE